MPQIVKFSWTDPKNSKTKIHYKLLRQILHKSMNNNLSLDIFKPKILKHHLNFKKNMN